MRLIGAGIYNLTSEEGRQLTLEDFFTEAKEKREEKKEALLRELGERYHLDFAGHLEQIFQSDTLHRTVEYMRKHRP